MLGPQELADSGLRIINSDNNYRDTINTPIPCLVPS